MEIILKLEELFDHMTVKSFSLLMMDNLVKLGNDLEDCFVFPMDLYKKAVNCLVIAKQEADIRIFRYYTPVFKMVFMKSADLAAAMQHIYEHEHFKDTKDKIPALRDQYPAANYDKECKSVIKKMLNSKILHDSHQLNIISREFAFYLTIAPKHAINTLMIDAAYASSYPVLDVVIKILHRLPAFFTLRTPNVYFHEQNELVVVANFRTLICTNLRNSSKLTDIRYLATELTSTHRTKENLDEDPPTFNPNEMITDLVVDLIERVKDNNINVLLEMLHTMLPLADDQKKFWRIQWKKADPANKNQIGFVDPLKMQNALYDLFKRDLPFKPTKSIVKAYKELYDRLKKDQFVMTDYEEDVSISFIKEQEEIERAEQEEKERIEREERERIEQAEREERERTEREELEQIEYEQEMKRQRLQREEEKKRQRHEREERERVKREQEMEQERAKQQKIEAERAEKKRIDEVLAEKKRIELEIAEQKRIELEVADEQKRIQIKRKHKEEVQRAKSGAEKQFGSQETIGEEVISEMDATLDTVGLSNAGSESNIAEPSDTATKKTRKGIKSAKAIKPRSGKGKKITKAINPSTVDDHVKDADEQEKVSKNVTIGEATSKLVVVAANMEEKAVDHNQNLEVNENTVQGNPKIEYFDIITNKLVVEEEKENEKASSEVISAIVLQVENAGSLNDNNSVKSYLDPNAQSFNPPFPLSPSNQQVAIQAYRSTIGQYNRTVPVFQSSDANVNNPPYHRYYQTSGESNSTFRGRGDHQKKYQRYRPSWHHNVERTQALLNIPQSQSHIYGEASNHGRRHDEKIGLHNQNRPYRGGRAGAFARSGGFGYGAVDRSIQYSTTEERGGYYGANPTRSRYPRKTHTSNAGNADGPGV